MDTIIRVRSGGIVISYDDPIIGSVLSPLLSDLTEFQMIKDWKTKQYNRVTKSKWYRLDKDLKEIRFHKHHEKDVFDYINGYPNAESEFKVIQHNPVNSDTIELKWKSPKMPRNRQPEYIEYLCKDKHVNILPLTMGGGKTYCAINSWSKLSVRVCLVIAPKYEDNWHDSIFEFLDVSDSDVLFVSGMDAMVSYMNTLIELKSNPYKIVVFSLNTMQGFMNNYTTKAYPLTPDQLFDLSGFGVKCVDEAHQSMNFHALLDMYSNIRIHQFLTATLVQESPYLADMENVIYPHKDRCPVEEPTNHVELKAFSYRFATQPPAHTSVMGYSHTKFEGTIFKKKRLLKEYLLFWGRLVYTHFTNTKVEGDIGIIYFSTINMVKAFDEFMKKMLPDVNTLAYLAGMNESALDGVDFIISTSKKLGTGFDRPGLTRLFQTILVSSKGENLQIMGRLREIKDETKTTQYLYGYCAQIPKHKQYHDKRLKDLKPFINKADVMSITKPIG